MSRFDLFFVLQDIRDETQDSNVAKHILAQHFAKEPDTVFRVVAQFVGIGS
ncbi:unnamed protein product [Symbiodinium natans]|uniref:MCM C-terminal AAA(+) ATPase domain-containing protein n=1 Tax=Symbiodinium natans TaxID=878477 RepID=A0A812QTL9_9DINO|nr:unnamed protein product [Symbiodinium natans]